ncbi:MAG: metal ABC transporter substrate-binding protein [Kiritimatiellia bacterium]|nr:metal ABC transporter substrate-binding protein [Kiritimatiellia bacterium]
MKRIFFTVLAAVALGLSAPAQAAKLKIVTTTSDLADIASRIAGEHGDVRFICKGNEDPHFLNARPSYILMARDAELWIRVGMELEIGWEPPVLDGSRNTRIRVGQPGHLDASERVIRLDVPEGPISRDMGDVHPSGNPHYWLDPWNVRVVAETMAERMGTLRPVGKSAFQENLSRFKRELDERMFGKELVADFGGEALWKAAEGGTLDLLLQESEKKPGGWVGQMQPLRGKAIVTYHKSWEYFVRRFGMTVAMELEPKPGIPPTAAHLTAVAERMKQEGIGFILQEPFYNRKAADRTASRTGARVLVAASSVGGTPQATDLFRVFDEVVSAFTDGSR